MNTEHRKKKLEEFQGIFETVFRKLKRQNEFFPKTKYKLADGHILILMYLFKKKMCTVSDITSYLGITSGGGTVLTDALLKHNLITRTRSEADRRVVQLSLTKEGESIVEQIIKQRAKMFTQLFDGIEEDDIEKIISIFYKLDDTLA
ncbi:MarR family winged helix-turn-helix transcriptional regulator [Priestia megaterium]|uniref:MarR family winged helix-turn-helix transcriptional regulator n=1 Tax=Priestia megaterium TaxID=1404 RepID=UPI0023DA4B67|nr:MarR family transcriptional regulator [Priestia megaterium]MDF2013316.1 MarR family transcriptional regulator [Priestia megaterium]